MSLVTCALPMAVGLVAGIVTTVGGPGRVRAMVLRPSSRSTSHFGKRRSV
jgi:hypothetical protein